MISVSKKDESVLDKKEQATLERTIRKIELFFPEHKVFAMDALCSQQRETSAKLAKKLGYDSVADFLLAYGFESIKGPDVYEIRKNCGIKPGEEPELIKERVENAITSLNEYYPDHIIEGSFNREHSNLFSKLSGFYQWLGYKSMEDMLAAYGFTYNVKAGRSKSVDPEAIIAELRIRYPNGTDMKVGDIKDANPDLKIKSVMNLSKELFGMTFGNYLEEQGIIVSKKQRQEEKQAIRAASLREELEQYDETIMSRVLGWKVLPHSAKAFLKEYGGEIPNKYEKVLRELSISTEMHLRELGVLEDDKTNNELRKLISSIDFAKLL